MTNHIGKFLFGLTFALLLMTVVNQTCAQSSGSSTTCPVGNGTAYYLAPNGDDTGTGTISAPWKTFAHAIPQLNSGDTLLLKNGTYNRSNSGYPVINCATTANNGTSGNPITIQAENERQAYLEGDGRGKQINMNNCSYWSIEGLLVTNQERNESSNNSNIAVENSDHITLRKLLLAFNNRVNNTHLIALIRTHDSLVEDSEFYSYHRHGILLAHSNNNTFRRLYANSRGWADLPGGYPSGPNDRGDSLIAIYPGSNNIIENVISEGQGKLAEVNATAITIGNRILGSISINEQDGVWANARGNTLDTMPRDTTLQDFVSLNPRHSALYGRAAKNTTINNLSVFGGGGAVATDDLRAGRRGDGYYSNYVTNMAVQDVRGTAHIQTAQDDWFVNYSNMFNNTRNYNDTSRVTNSSTVDPQFGPCRVFVPDTSPLKGAGLNGDDIGANILCRYQDGVLTNEQLWDWTTGEFSCGAIVPGLNDRAGESCFDVHERLNVNTNGCSLPTNPPCTDPANTNSCVPPLTIIELDVVVFDENCVLPGQPAPLDIQILDKATGAPPTISGIMVQISNVPNGFTLSAGSVILSAGGFNVWEVPQAQLSGMTITPPAGFVGTVPLVVNAYHPSPPPNTVILPETETLMITWEDCTLPVPPPPAPPTLLPTNAICPNISGPSGSTTGSKSDRDNAIEGRWLPTFFCMGHQFSVVMMNQVFAIGQFFDARQQLQTQRLYNKLAAEAHKDYHPSTQMCTFGTNVRSLARSEEISDTNTEMLNQTLMARQTLSANVSSSVGPHVDKWDRLEQFKNTYCDPADNNGTLGAMCGGPGGPVERRNKDIDFTRFDNTLTLDFDLTDNPGTLIPFNLPTPTTDDEEDVLALAYNLFSHDTFTRLPERHLQMDYAKDEFQEMRSLYAMRSVAFNSFAHLVGMRAAPSAPTGSNPPTIEAAPFMRNIMTGMGLTQDEVDEFIGENPSYLAQMEVLTKKIYQTPEFYTNLYGKPENVERVGVTIQALTLMNDRDRYESSLRKEMLISLILELKLREHQREVNNEILGSISNYFPR